MKQKLVYAGYVKKLQERLSWSQWLSGSRWENRKKRGGPRTTWTDNVIQWMQENKDDEIKRLNEDRTLGER